MALRLGLGLGLAGGAPFSPSSLYGSAGGDYWDFSDTSTLFQDTAATSPVTTAAQTIARVNGKLGRHNLTQGTAGQRPAWAALPSGKMGAQFDGTDDGLSVAGFDMTGSDEITYIIGLRKASDAAVGMALEVSAAAASNNGTFSLLAPSSPTTDRYAMVSRGNATASVAAIGSSYDAPQTIVIGMKAKISTDTLEMYVNGAIYNQVMTDQGTGNYGNHTLYIGRRAGASFPFNGFITSLIIIGRNLSASELVKANAWVNARTGAY